MKTKIKGKLLLSLATLSLALVSSVGSTFAWFLISDKADLTGLDINVTTGSSVLLKDEGNSTSDPKIYTNSFTIKPKDGAKWEMITPTTTKVTATSADDGATSGTATTMTVADGFQQVDISSTVNKKEWQYKQITAGEGASPYNGTHVYGNTSTVEHTTSTTAYYYKVDFKYRVSTGYDVAITVKDIEVKDKSNNKIENPSQTTQSVDKVVRVAFQDQSATTASVYRIAKTTSTDYNAEQMNQLVKLDGNKKLTGDQYNCTLLSKDNKHKVTAPTENIQYTSDNAFYYGTTTMYVWYDGTDHACSNAVFEQTCSFNIEFSTVEQTTN